MTTQVPAAVAVKAAPLTEHEPEVTANDFAPVPELPEVDNKILESAVIVVASGTTVMLCATKPMVTAALAAEADPVPMRLVALTVIVYVLSMSNVKVAEVNVGVAVTGLPPLEDVAVTV